MSQTEKILASVKSLSVAQQIDLIESLIANLDTERTSRETFIAELQRLRLNSSLQSTTKQRVPGLHLGTMTVSDDFDTPLPDEFWLGKE